MQRSKQLDIYKPTITKWINDSLAASRGGAVAGTPAGLVPWANVSKAGSSLADLESHSHGLLSDLTGTDHHTQYVHVSSPRTISAMHNFTAGVTSPDADSQFVMGRALVGNVGHADYAAFAHRDHANTGGYGFLQGANGYTFVNAPTGAAVLHRINNADVMAMDAARLNPAGSILKDLGDYNRKWRTLFAAELYVETLVAQSVLATIGGRIMVAPTAKLIADVDTSQTTIDTDFSSYLNGDYIYFATAPGGIAQIEVMKVTSAAAAITGGYRYSVIRALDGTPVNSWVAGDAGVSLGNAVGKGYIELTSTSTIHNHLGPNITIYSRVSTANWNDVKPVVTMGNLRSFVDYSTDEVGFGTGNDLTLSPVSGFKGVTIDRTNGIRQFNTSIKQYQSGALFLTLDTGGLEFTGIDQSYARVRWLTTGDTAEIGTHLYGDGYKRMDLRSWSGTNSAVRVGAWNSGQTNLPVAYVEVNQASYASKIALIADGVGVGTASPSYKLHVASGGTAGLAVEGNARFGQGGMWGAIDGPATSGWCGFGGNFYYSSNTPKYRASNYASQIFFSDTIAFNTATSGTADGTITFNERMRLSNAGNVGIGESSPVYRLHIKGDNTSGNYPIIKIQNTASGGRSWWLYSGANGVQSDFGIYDESAGAYRAIINSSGLLFVGNTTDIGGGAKIQTNGNMWAQGAVTTETFIQLKATTAPATASGYARIFLRSSDNKVCILKDDGTVTALN